jgi:hypothetical protein
VGGWVGRRAASACSGAAVALAGVRPAAGPTPRRQPRSSSGPLTKQLVTAPSTHAGGGWPLAGCLEGGALAVAATDSVWTALQPACGRQRRRVVTAGPPYTAPTNAPPTLLCEGPACSRLPLAPRQPLSVRRPGPAPHCPTCSRWPPRQTPVPAPCGASSSGAPAAPPGCRRSSRAPESRPPCLSRGGGKGGLRRSARCASSRERRRRPARWGRVHLTAEARAAARRAPEAAQATASRSTTVAVSPSLVR